MPEQRIHRKASRTAAMTCLSRAASFLEHNPAYRTHDHLSRRILPGFLRILIHFSLFRKIFFRYVSPPGVYEYVIARTRYIDAAFEQALSDGFDQILLFGAAYDTRALRFQEITGQTQIFELDTPSTQQAKIRQFKKRHLAIPPNLVFISMEKALPASYCHHLPWPEE